MQVFEQLDADDAFERVDQSCRENSLPSTGAQVYEDTTWLGEGVVLALDPLEENSY